MASQSNLIKLWLTLICVVSCVSVSGNWVQCQESSLELVAILFRHGLRTPSKFYQSDPYKDVEKYWSIGLGQLTLEGKRQMYKLGKTLRARYKGLISKYRADLVRVNSSDIDRCHMSAASLLAGWFPPTTDQLWSQYLKWQPIPIHSVPIEKDRVLALMAPCPKYDTLKEEVDNEIAANETESDKRLYKFLTKRTKQNVLTTGQVASIFKTLTIEDRNNYVLPSWTYRVYPEQMKKRASLALSSWSWTKLMKRITGGPLVKEILKQFRLKSNDKNKQKKKLLLFSGHEDTVISVWRAMGFEELLLPDFGASLIFELHKTDYNYFVKMFYMNSTSSLTPYELKIPECESPCLLEELSKLTKYMRAVDWDKDCRLP